MAEKDHFKNKEDFADEMAILTKSEQNDVLEQWQRQAKKHGVKAPKCGDEPLIDYVWELRLLVRARKASQELGD